MPGLKSGKTFLIPHDQPVRHEPVLRMNGVLADRVQSTGSLASDRWNEYCHKFVRTRPSDETLNRVRPRQTTSNAGQ